MSRISEAEVARLAALARLEVTPEETAKLAKDLESILGYVAAVEAAEAAGKVPAEGEPFREDGPAERPGTGGAASFPETEKGFLRVPRVLPSHD